MLHGLANGDDLRTVECDRARSSYGEENTFPEDAVDRETIEAMVIAHAETVARRLRRDGVQRPDGHAQVPAVDADERVSLGHALADARGADRRRRDHLGARRWSFGTRSRAGISLRLVGVQVTGLDKDRPVQIGLFEAPEDERRNALNAALDDIVAKFGPGAVKRGLT